MKDLAIICSVIPARHELLLRSLQTWQRSIAASGLDCSINIWSEGCHLYEALNILPPDPNIVMAGQEAFSGSHILGYNYFWDRVEAKVIVFSHPDLLFPEMTIRTAYEKAQDNTYVAFKCFWMSPDMTHDIDRFDWLHPETLEHEPMLYELDVMPQGHFYANPGVRQITYWEASTTYALNRQTAERLYPMPDFGHQVTDDPYQVGARQRLGIVNHTVMEPILFHQFHPNSRTITGEQAVEEAQAELIKRFGR